MTLFTRSEGVGDTAGEVGEKGKEFIFRYFKYQVPRELLRRSISNRLMNMVSEHHIRSTHQNNKGKKQ